MSTFDKTHKQYTNVVRFLHSRHSKGEKARMLEVGAAEMIVKRWLPSSIKYDSLDFGAENNPSLSKDTKYTYLFDLDKGRFPIPSNTYDYILCFETLEHVMYPDCVLKELMRVAKKDAIFFLSLPNEYNFAQRLYYLFGKKTFCDEPFQVVEKHLHIHKPRVKDILRLFGKYIRIQEVTYLWQSTILPAWVDRIVNQIAQISPSLFSRMVIVRGIRK